MTVKELFKSRLFYLFALVMLCSGASELAMSQWASAFAESGLKVSKTMGDLLGPCFFAVLMGSARVIYSFLSTRFSLSRLMIMSGALCICAYLVAALSPNSVVALLGCAVCGFSVGIMWPGTFSLAAEKIPAGKTAMFAMLALFGDSGCSLGPAVVGRGIEMFDGDFSKGLLFALIFPAFLIFGVMKIKKKTA